MIDPGGLALERFMGEQAQFQPLQFMFSYLQENWQNLYKKCLIDSHFVKIIPHHYPCVIFFPLIAIRTQY